MKQQSTSQIPYSPTQFSSPEPDQKPSKKRLDWIDAVKGMTIILVVFYHTTTFNEPYGWGGGYLATGAVALRSFRMPLFFMIAGLFFLHRVDKPWKWWLKNRIAPFLYLYLVWYVFRLILTDLDLWRNKSDYGLDDYTQIALDPLYGPWFIFALALYFLVAKAIRPLPVWAQALIACAISLPFIIGLIQTTAYGWENVASYFLLFWIGAYCKPLILRLPEWTSPIRFAAFAALWAVTVLIMFKMGGTFDSPLRVPLTFFGVIMAIMGTLLIHKAAPGLGLTRLGQRTLPIYLLHMPLVGFFYTFTDGLPDANLAIQTIVPIITTSVVMALSLFIWKYTNKIPGIYNAPWHGEGPHTLNAK